MIKRLSRLPPYEKAQIVKGQIHPIFLYGSELHDEEGKSLVAEITRSVLKAWRGTKKERLLAITRWK